MKSDVHLEVSDRTEQMVSPAFPIERQYHYEIECIK